MRWSVQFVRETHVKHTTTLTNVQKALLFRRVGRQDREDNDPRIAAGCQHFADQYYFLNEEYGKAFEHLLAANKAYREIGYRRIPEIGRYLIAELVTDLDPVVAKTDVVPQDVGRVLLNLFNNAFYAASDRQQQTNGQDRCFRRIKRRLKSVPEPNVPKGSIRQPDHRSRKTPTGISKVVNQGFTELH